MPESEHELTRRRLLGGLVAIGATGAAAGAGTMAFFTESETSGNNAITSGTLTLGFGSGGTFSFNTGLVPTESTTGSVTLQSGGSVTGSLDVDVDYSESDSGSNSQNVTAQQVAENLEVQTLTYGGTDLTGQISTSNSPPTLHDLATNPHGAGETTQNDLINLSDPGTGTDFIVELRLKNVGSEFQSDGIAITFDFHLNQNDSQ
mgnify:CR=1 FL=1